MKKLLTILTLLVALVSQAQTFTFTQIPFSDVDILLSAGRGAEKWHDAYGAIPNNGIAYTDNYYRLQWNSIERVTQNNYVWTDFDNLIKDAINQGQKFAFGIMTVYSGAGLETYGGARSAYPEYLHNLMQASGIPDWDAGNSWIPNYNHASYLSRLRALYAAIRNHINSTSYLATGGPHSGQTIDFADVIYYAEARGYGEWGEWHSGSYATWASLANINGNNQRPTVASLKEIIKCATDEFPAWRLVIPVAAFDGGMTGIPAFIPLPEVAHYALTTTNAKGPIGIRRDQWGDRDGYLHNLMAGNTQTWLTSATFGSMILDKWRTSLVLGEPPGYTQGSFPFYADLENQLRLYHATSLGNGNFGFGGGLPATQDQDLIRASFKATGFRFNYTSGNCLVSSNFTINLGWHNVGIAPTYETWTVQYLLRNGAGTQVWTANSSFNPELFLPAGAATTRTDIYSLPAIAAGTYKLYVKTVDPNGYRQPLPIATLGRQTDGSYFLANVVFSGAPANQSPTANAGPNQSITASSATLTGSGTDVDGTIATYAWSQVSGPSIAVIGSPSSTSTLVSSLVAGQYFFTLTVTDDDGATGSDAVQITVNTAVPPVANAGANQTITLPTSQVTVNGSASTDNVGITGYAWSKVSGPAGQTITNPNNVSTTITGLVQGSYTFRLTVSDASELSHSDDMVVTVLPGNAAPVSNAGANQTITLPTSSVNLSGSLSTDDVGITAYLWTKVGGPATFTITSPTTVNTSVTGLVAGVYIFRLRVTDAGGLTHTDDVQVTVNAAPNTPPVANAGLNQSITLPTSSVILNGSGSTDNIGITGYLWTKVSGTGGAIVTPTTVSTNITGLTAGVYIFRLQVTDGGGLTSNDDVQVTVNAAPNTAPVANAGPNQTITLPTSSVTVNGSASTDNVGITAYLWTKISGTGGTITSPTLVSTTITGLSAGTYVFRLRVTDGGGLTSFDDIQILVNPIPNSAPVAIAGPNQAITLPTSTVTVNGSASTDDVGIVSYLWTRQSGPLTQTIATPFNASTQILGLVDGVYQFRLTVTDGSGLTSFDDLDITVNAAPNAAPIANAGANQSITLPTSSVSVSGSASTDDNAITAYLWTKISGTGGAISAPTSVNTNFTGLTAGAYTFRLRVTDAQGLFSEDDIQIIVNPAANNAPVSNAGGNQTITLPTSSVSLNGSSSTDDVGITGYQWTKISGPNTFTIVSPTSANTNVTNLGQGTYTFRLTVTDGSLTDTDEVDITVRPRPAIDISWLWRWIFKRR